MPPDRSAPGAAEQSMGRQVRTMSHIQAPSLSIFAAAIGSHSLHSRAPGGFTHRVQLKMGFTSIQEAVSVNATFVPLCLYAMQVVKSTA